MSSTERQRAVRVAEKVLGKALPFGAEVHHVDGEESNDKHTNLVICEDKAYHKLLHRRTKALKACGHADWRRCNRCGEYDDPQNLSVSPDERHAHHRKCKAQYGRLWRAGLSNIFRI